MPHIQHKLSDLLPALGCCKYTHSSKEVIITGLTSDSRRVRSGDLFVAVSGDQTDGHRFIPEVIKKGAVAIVGESALSLSGAVYIKVPNSRKVLGNLCSAWYGYPSKQLKMIGVTGTDGKTTTVGLIHAIFRMAGVKMGSISTIGAVIGNEKLETGLHTTTPEPLLLQKLLAKMVSKGMQYAVLEVTSHGLDQFRVEGVDFDTAVLTNLTHEHLDYHKTFEEYRRVKGMFLKNAVWAVLNADDKNIDYFKGVVMGKAFKYGFKDFADVVGRNLRLSSQGLDFELSTTLLVKQGSNPFPLQLESSLWGEFNAQNILAAITTALLYGIDPQLIVKAVSQFKSLLGRMELIDIGQNFTVIVDFAHTPNSLEVTLKYLRSVLPKNARLISVFGCAGERDYLKRPMMGKISAQQAHLTVLTAEDSRTEPVEDILNQIKSGCLEEGSQEDKHFFIIPNRKQAIEYAICQLARKNDIVVVCGKGHERSMCFGTTEIPWSDQQIAKEALQKLQKNSKIRRKPL